MPLDDDATIDQRQLQLGFEHASQTGLNIRLSRADKNLVTGAQSNLETGRIAAAQSTVWFLGPMRVCPERHLDRSVRFFAARPRAQTHRPRYVRRA